MGRFHISQSLGALVLATAALSGTGGCNCNERVVEEEPVSEPGRAACMVLIGAKMFSTDGRKHVIRTPARAASVCRCLTDEDFAALAHHDEMNDLALDVCEQTAAASDVAAEYPTNNCAELHGEGEWLDKVYWATPDGPYSVFVPDGLSCGGSET